MTIETLTSKQYLFNLNIIFFALLASQVLFPLVILFLSLTDNLVHNQDAFSSILIYLVPVVIIAGIIGDRFFTVVGVFKLKAQHSLNYKLSRYRIASLVKLMVFLEMPSLFASFAFFYTGNFIYLGFSALVLLIYIFKKPSVESICKELELKGEDRKNLNNPDAIVGEFHVGTD